MDWIVCDFVFILCPDLSLLFLIFDNSFIYISLFCMRRFSVNSRKIAVNK